MSKINYNLPKQFLENKGITLEDPKEHIRIINDLYKFYPESDEDSAQYRACIPSLIVRSLMQCYDPSDSPSTTCFRLLIDYLNVDGIENIPPFCEPWVEVVSAIDVELQTVIFYNFETDNFTLYVREYDMKEYFVLICTHREICVYLNFFLKNFKVRTCDGQVIGPIRILVSD